MLESSYSQSFPAVCDCKLVIRKGGGLQALGPIALGHIDAGACRWTGRQAGSLSAVPFAIFAHMVLLPGAEILGVAKRGVRGGPLGTSYEQRHDSAEYSSRASCVSVSMHGYERRPPQ